MAIVYIIRNRILFIQICRRKILPLDIADLFWIIAVEKIIALEINFFANDIIVINAATPYSVDTGIVSAKQSCYRIIRANRKINITSAIFKLVHCAGKI